jgi:hypothetical protein
MNNDLSYSKMSIMPQIDRTFKASKYIGVFDIISLRIEYKFDDEMNYTFISQAFTARKACSGPNGWCAPINVQSQEYYLYKSTDGEIMTSRLIEDDRHHYYMIVDFRQNLKVDEIIQFSTETKQSLEPSILQATSRRTKTLFLSRLYGASCEDCEIVIHIPNYYKVKKSIPNLTGKASIYKYRPIVKKLEPIQIALVVRKRYLPFVTKIFNRKTHPIVWAVVSAFLGLLLMIIWTTVKSVKGVN